ncbi:hypothetical protein SpCBS45565_g07978, partial [Spizellomyces sp. 'palustris']
EAADEIDPAEDVAEDEAAAGVEEAPGELDPDWDEIPAAEEEWGDDGVDGELEADTTAEEYAETDPEPDVSVAIPLPPTPLEDWPLPDPPPPAPELAVGVAEEEVVVLFEELVELVVEVVEPDGAVGRDTRGGHGYLEGLANTVGNSGIAGLVTLDRGCAGAWDHLESVDTGELASAEEGSVTAEVSNTLVCTLPDGALSDDTNAETGAEGGDGEPKELLGLVLLAEHCVPRSGCRNKEKME